MLIEELNNILYFTAQETMCVSSCLPNDTPAEISIAVGKLLQEAAEKIRKLAKGEDKPEELTARESRIIAMCERYDMIGPLDDGYQYFWPKNHGCLSPVDLRTIADELDRRNAKWDGQVKSDPVFNNPSF